MTDTRPAPKTRRRVTARAAVLALPLAIGLLGGAVTPAQAAIPASPAPLSCQGKTIDTKAPIHYPAPRP